MSNSKSVVNVDSFASRLAKKLALEEKKERAKNVELEKKAKVITESTKTSVKSESKIRTKADDVKKSEPDPADGFVKRLEQKLKLAEQKQAQNDSKSTNTAGTSTKKTNDQKIIDNKSGSNSNSKKCKLTMPKTAKYTEESLQKALALAYKDFVQNGLHKEHQAAAKKAIQRKRQIPANETAKAKQIREAKFAKEDEIERIKMLKERDEMEPSIFGCIFAYDQVLCCPNKEIKLGDEISNYLEDRATQYYKEQRKLEDEQNLKVAESSKSSATNNKKKEVKSTSVKHEQKMSKQESKKTESKKMEEEPPKKKSKIDIFAIDEVIGKSLNDRYMEALAIVNKFSRQERKLMEEKNDLFREFSVPFAETAEAKKIREKKEIRKEILDYQEYSRKADEFILKIGRLVK